MVIKLWNTLIVISILNINLSCLSSTNHSLWNLEWHVYNSNDSLHVADTLIAQIKLNKDALNDGPWSDTTSDGKIEIRMGMYDEIFNSSLSVQAVITKEMKVIIDTTIEWSNINFTRGMDQFGHKNQNVNYMNFYVNSDSHQK